MAQILMKAAFWEALFRTLFRIPKFRIFCKKILKFSSKRSKFCLSPSELVSVTKNTRINKVNEILIGQKKNYKTNNFGLKTRNFGFQNLKISVGKLEVSVWKTRSFGTKTEVSVRKQEVLVRDRNLPSNMLYR
jgi:hypothetical protein